MGHATHTFFFEVATLAEARAAFRRKKEDHRDEHGHGESLDSIANADEPSDTGKVFASKREAADWLEENIWRYDSLAARVEGRRLPKDMTSDEKKAVDAKVAKATARESDFLPGINSRASCN